MAEPVHRGENDEQVTTEQHDDVVVLTLHCPDRLDRSDRLTASTPRTSGGLVHAVEAADADIGAVVVAGAGRGSCGGADSKAVFDGRASGADGVAPPPTRDMEERPPDFRSPVGGGEA